MRGSTRRILSTTAFLFLAACEDGDEAGLPTPTTDTTSVSTVSSSQSESSSQSMTPSDSTLTTSTTTESTTTEPTTTDATTESTDTASTTSSDETVSETISDPFPVWLTMPNDFASAQSRTQLEIVLKSPALATLEELDLPALAQATKISTWPLGASFPANAVLGSPETDPVTGFASIKVRVSPTDALPTTGWLALYIDRQLPQHVLSNLDPDDSVPISRWRQDSAPTVYRVRGCKKSDGVLALSLDLSEPREVSASASVLEVSGDGTIYDCYHQDTKEQSIEGYCDIPSIPNELEIRITQALQGKAGGSTPPFTIKLEASQLHDDPTNSHCWIARPSVVQGLL